MTSKGKSEIRYVYSFPTQTKQWHRTMKMNCCLGKFSVWLSLFEACHEYARACHSSGACSKHAQECIAGHVTYITWWVQSLTVTLVDVLIWGHPHTRTSSYEDTRWGLVSSYEDVFSYEDTWCPHMRMHPHMRTTGPTWCPHMRTWILTIQKCPTILKSDITFGFSTN